MISLVASVSISGDTIVVGAARMMTNYDMIPASAYVFEKPDSGGWTSTTQDAKSLPVMVKRMISLAFQFPSAVTLLLLEQIGDDDNGYNSGSAYVFEAAAAHPMVINCSTQSYLLLEDCYRLLFLYDATNGSGWADQGGWTTNTDPCTAWSGVTCEEFTEYTPEIPPVPYLVNRVTQIGLNNNRLSGHIPASIGDLTRLKSLNLRNNRIGGTIPPELGNLGALTSLYLDDNNLWGNIPDELGNLTNLDYFFMDNTDLRGVVPLSIAQIGADATDCRFHDTSLCIPNTAEYLAIGEDPICTLSLSSTCYGVCGDGAIAALRGV